MASLQITRVVMSSTNPHTGYSMALLSVMGVLLTDYSISLPDSIRGVPVPDPVVILLGGVSLTLLVTSAYILIKQYRTGNADELYRILSNRDEVTVLMHPNPDPDAMASAMAVNAIAEAAGVTAHTQYTGQIRHQENRAFKTVLDFSCEGIESASELRTPESVILVDHNTPRGFTDAETIEPIAVVDHHPGNGTGTELTDVRDEYGSCATIFIEYLLDLNAVVKTNDTSNEELEEAEIIIDSRLATGLVYGVYSDTDNLTRGCIRPDFQACSLVFDAIDTDKLNRIENPEVSHDILQIKADAIMNVQIDGSFGVCNTGMIDNVDALSQAVDELMRIEGVTAAVVYGERDGTIHMSGRSHDDRVHMGEALNKAVSNIKHSSAGGHARMGGGQVPVTHMSEISSSDGVPYEEFNELLFSHMNGDY